MIYLMLFFGLVFLVGLMFWFLNAWRDERNRPVGGAPNLPG